MRFFLATIGLFNLQSLTVHGEIPTNDIPFDIITNPAYDQFVIRVRRDSDGYEGYCEVDFYHVFNRVIRDPITQVAPESVSLLTINNQPIPLGNWLNRPPVPHIWERGYYDYDVSMGRISVLHGSQFAQRFGNLMITPNFNGGQYLRQRQGDQAARVEPYDDIGFRFYANVVDPARYCLDNSIVYTSTIPNTPEIRFMAQTSLIRSSQPQGEEGNSEPVIIAESQYAGEYDMTDVHIYITLPEEVNNALNAEVERLTGLSRYDYHDSPNCESFVDQLPTLKFTLLDPNGTREVVDFMLEPSDYVKIERTPSSIRCNIQTYANGGLSMGHLFWKQFGVFIDYNNERIGFCDPL